MALMCSADEELKGKFVYAFLPFTKKRLAALTRTKFRAILSGLQHDDLTSSPKKGTGLTKEELRLRNSAFLSGRIGRV